MINIYTQNVRDLLDQCENDMEQYMLAYKANQSPDAFRNFNSIVLALSLAQFAIKRGLEGDFD